MAHDMPTSSDWLDTIEALTGAVLESFSGLLAARLFTAVGAWMTLYGSGLTEPPTVAQAALKTLCELTDLQRLETLETLAADARELDIPLALDGQEAAQRFERSKELAEKLRWAVVALDLLPPSFTSPEPLARCLKYLKCDLALIFKRLRRVEAAGSADAAPPQQQDSSVPASPSSSADHWLVEIARDLLSTMSEGSSSVTPNAGAEELLTWTLDIIENEGISIDSSEDEHRGYLGQNKVLTLKREPFQGRTTPVVWLAFDVDRLGERATPLVARLQDDSQILAWGGGHTWFVATRASLVYGTNAAQDALIRAAQQVALEDPSVPGGPPPLDEAWPASLTKTLQMRAHRWSPALEDHLRRLSTVVPPPCALRALFQLPAESRATACDAVAWAHVANWLVDPLFPPLKAGFEATFGRHRRTLDTALKHYERAFAERAPTARLRDWVYRLRPSAPKSSTYEVHEVVAFIHALVEGIARPFKELCGVVKLVDPNTTEEHAPANRLLESPLGVASAEAVRRFNVHVMGRSSFKDWRPVAEYFINELVHDESSLFDLLWDDYIYSLGRATRGAPANAMLGFARSDSFGSPPSLAAGVLPVIMAVITGQIEPTTSAIFEQLQRTLRSGTGTMPLDTLWSLAEGIPEVLDRVVRAGPQSLT